MHLIYIDESGNTGHNLDDADQPIFVLGALIVPEDCWQAVEADLNDAVGTRLPAFDPDDEVHCAQMRSGKGYFEGVSVGDRVALRDDWLKIAHKHKLRFVYRSIEKKRYQAWMVGAFGDAVKINPHVAAFSLVAVILNAYLAQLGARGMFISDENKEIVREVEKSIQLLRFASGPLRLSQFIEKGFFIDSVKSRVLQLCDVCVFHARKKAEIDRGATPRGSSSSSPWC